MQTQVVVGTENGLFAIAEENATWSIAGSYLPDVQISGIARDGANAVLVSSMGAGLFRVDLDRGVAIPLGAGTLPPKLRGVTVSPLGSKTIFVAAEPAAIWSSADDGQTWTENASVKALAEAHQWKYPVPTVPSHLRNVMVSWDDPRYMYAAVQVGGILRSEDGGTTWSHVNDGFDPDVHSLFQHPTDPTILYAVCGGGGPVDKNRPNPLPLPLGRPLYRSRDRGLTWECISATFDRSYGIGMSAAPTMPATLVSAVARDQPPFWKKRSTLADAVVVMSRDDGSSWQQCRDGLPEQFATMVEAIEVDRRHGNRILIGTGGGRRRDAAGERVVGGAESAIYVCDDPAGHWSQIPVALPGISTMLAL